MARYVIDNQSAPIVWEGLDETGRILQNAKNLLRLARGELPYDRLRGMDMRMNGIPITQLKAEAAQKVHNNLLWETRVKLIGTRVSLKEDGEILIQAEVEV